MRLKIARYLLLDTLTLFSPIFKGKAISPTTRRVRLSARYGILEIGCTNFVVEGIRQCTATVPTPGEIAVEGVPLLDAVKAITSPEIDINLEPGGLMVSGVEGFTATLPVVTVEELPKVFKIPANAERHGLTTETFEESVRDYQRIHGLTADGFIGPKTAGYMRVSERYPNEPDIDRLSDVIHAESRTGSDLERRCVAETVINRILFAPLKYGCSVEEVVSGRAYAVRSRKDIPSSVSSRRIASMALSDGPQYAKRATHFFSPRNMPAKERLKPWRGESKARQQSGNHPL